MSDSTLPPNPAALQHGPRPLPLFLDMLRAETASAPERRKAALAGLAAYQAAMREAPPSPPPVVARHGRAVVYDYGANLPGGAAGGGNGAAPVLFVPSLINPPHILDLSPKQSLLRWLAAQGFRPMLLDWGTPASTARAVDITAHVEQILVPAVQSLARAPVLAGYCLGGTMAAAAACLTPVAGLAMIAAPWHFSAFGPRAQAEMTELWATARPVCEAMGLVPMEVLQSGFWRLDPARTIAKYEAFATMDATGDTARSFVALEDWANAGAPLTYAAGAQMFDDFFGRNTPGTGQWLLSNGPANLAALSCPTVDFVSLNDRIVPAAAAAGFADRHELSAGHVGMVVGSRAQSALWEPLAGWLNRLGVAK